MQLSLLVPTDVNVNSSTLVSKGLITADQRPYRLYQAKDLLAGTAIQAQLQGLPVVQTAAPSLNQANIWLIAGLLLMLAILAVTWFLCRFTRSRSPIYRGIPIHRGTTVKRSRPRSSPVKTRSIAPPAPSDHSEDSIEGQEKKSGLPGTPRQNQSAPPHSHERGKGENMTRSYLEMQGLKKSFGLKPILRGIDLKLNQGERKALMGANGAGKTTLLRILAGLTAPSAGAVRIAGLDLTRDAQRVRQLVGFVGHQPYLYDELTALENLLFFGRMYAVKDAQQRARALLHRVGLEKRVQDRVNTLSRGQLQRLALARALLHSPRLLLLDEPDTGLDEQGNELLELLLDEHVAQGGAALLATHQLAHALKLGDSIVTLDNGRIVSSCRGGSGAEWSGDPCGRPLESLKERT